MLDEQGPPGAEAGDRAREEPMVGAGDMVSIRACPLRLYAGARARVVATDKSKKTRKRLRSARGARDAPFRRDPYLYLVSGVSVEVLLQAMRRR